MNKHIIILIILLITAISCNDDFLDRAPYNALSDQTIWNSDENAVMAVNGIYSALAMNAMKDFNHFFTNMGPAGYGWVRPNDGLSQSRGTADYRNPKYLAFYRTFYTVIRYANDAISNLEDNTEISKELADRLRGEAKFMRGLSYFYLWNMYGGVIILDKPTNPSETYLPRNSVDEVKQLIISDFTSAIDLLPVSYTGADIGKVTKGAAIAMLGKTYLYDEQWDNAAEQLEKLLSSPFEYELVTDYADLFNWQTQPNSETVFSLNYINEQGYGSSFDEYYGNRSHQIFAGGWTHVEPRMMELYTHTDGTEVDWTTKPQRSNYSNDHDFGVDLISWFETTFTDMDNRLHKNIIVPGSTFVGKGNLVFKLYYPYKDYKTADPPPFEIFGAALNRALLPWRKFVTTGDVNIYRYDAPTDNPIIRFGDILLMYAEAKNEAEGPSDAVYSAVNRIRERADVVSLQTRLSKDQMREAIRIERYRELMGEGHLYFDLKRWGTADTSDPIFGLNHDVLEYTGTYLYTKVFTEKDYLFPIPGLEIDINTNIEQNPGW